jgi:hypothetical protein
MNGKSRHKTEIIMTESLMARINELISHYPRKKKNQLDAYFAASQDANILVEY